MQFRVPALYKQVVHLDEKIQWQGGGGGDSGGGGGDSGTVVGAGDSGRVGDTRGVRWPTVRRRSGSLVTPSGS